MAVRRSLGLPDLSMDLVVETIQQERRRSMASLWRWLSAESHARYSPPTAFPRGRGCIGEPEVQYDVYGGGHGRA